MLCNKISAGLMNCPDKTLLKRRGGGEEKPVMEANVYLVIAMSLLG